jgi:5-methylcytosine-specific restriction endonuclease McrA
MVMAHGSTTDSPNRGHLRQALKKQGARELARIHKERNNEYNPARHDWLVRHAERQNGLCAYCGIPMFWPPLRSKKIKKGCRATLDHVVPLARGGADSEANTVAACEACNKAKADMTAQMFRMSEFFIARQAYAATQPERKAVPLTVTVRKRPRSKPAADAPPSKGAR